jgi:hypothetical protein
VPLAEIERGIMTPEEIDNLGSLVARVASLHATVKRLTAERDYAVTVADSLRFHNERLERELADALRKMVDTRP